MKDSKANNKGGRTQGVFDSAFESAFTFLKAKNQPNTLPSQNCFSPKLFFLQYKTESSFHLLLSTVEVGNFKKITHLPSSKN